MDQICQVLDSSLLQALSYGIAVFGLFFSFRILGFPDLTIDGSFTLGGAITGTLITSGSSPILGIFISVLAGFLAGVQTGILHTKLRLSKLLSGILSMMILYSLNFRIMGQRPNLKLFGLSSAVAPIEKLDVIVNSWIHSNIGYQARFHIGSILFFGIIIFIIRHIMTRFLLTENGILMRAIGHNARLVINLGVSADKTKIIGLGIANSLVALSGSLISQEMGFVDINMGNGMIIIAIASLIIGEEIIRLFRKHQYEVGLLSISPILGSFLYYLLITIVLRLSTFRALPFVQIEPTDLKMITALVIILVVYVRKDKVTEILLKEDSL